MTRKLCAFLLLTLAAAALAPAPATAAPTRTVSIDDADRDGRYTGADVDAAIARCRPGCILQALAKTYNDVEATLDRGMTEGVILQGAGIGQTIFRAPVPQRGPIVRVSGVPAQVVLRDFTLDGRKQEQTSAALDGEGSGVAIASPSLVPSVAGVVERVEARNLITTGILLRDGAGWEVRNSQIHDIGCNSDFPCPKLTPRKPDPYVQGRKTVGFGISVIDSQARGANVHHNVISNVTKIGIEAFTWELQKPSRDFWFHDNEVRRAAESGIVSNGGIDGRIENNLVESDGGAGIIGSLGSGICCGGDVGTLRVAGNTVRTNEGPGFNLGCRGQLTVSANLAQGNCRKPLGNYGEISVNRTASDAAGLVLEGNQASPGSDGRGCAFALLLAGWSHVTLDGGSYRGGSLAGMHLTRDQDVVFRNAAIDGGGGPGIVIQSDVDGVWIEPSVVITHPKDVAVRSPGARNVAFGTAPPPTTAGIGAPGKPALISP